MKRNHLKALFGVLVVAVTASACTPLQIARFEQQTGVAIQPADEASLIALPDYMPTVCIWVDTGMRARGAGPITAQKSVKYAGRESGCCPTKRGGDMVDGACNVLGKTKAWRYDPTDTGVMQFNGFKPSGGLKAGSPAVEFCQSGVRRFLNEQWSDEVTYPCDQKQVLADPELQLDMLYALVSRCGFGAWEPVHGQYRCRTNYNVHA